ncbi:hypothetical protein [Haladaptatus caseinilyticus]|uniref:hypothetical protein n=1 Tax=Haladaptatus caseinilyticus TaxID=2993314 RepID=UPI00224B5430|nr:hypothetical protein [Haladaptatus caseinilyticus]
MGLQDVLDAAEAVGNRDEERREMFQTEFNAYENGDLDSFDETRDDIEHERAALNELGYALEAEGENIDELVDHAEFLSVDQAVRHRDEVVEKLEAHNAHLWTFHGEMSEALNTVESNLTVLVNDGTDAVEADPQPHFDGARRALERHNEVVEGLGKNLTILNAYLI